MTELPDNLLWDPGDARLMQPALPEGVLVLRHEPAPEMIDSFRDSGATEIFRVVELKQGQPVSISFYGATPVHRLHASVSFADDELPADRSEMRRLLSARLQAVGDELMQQWEARQEKRQCPG